MTTNRAHLAQLHTSRAMRDLEAMSRATAGMTRRADALLQTGPDRTTVDAAVRSALARDGALPASAHHPAPGAPAPLPRQTLAAALSTADAGIAHLLGVAHQGHQDTPAATIAPTRESATPTVTQPRYGGAPALDAGLPTQAMVEEAIGAMFGLPPTCPGR